MERRVKNLLKNNERLSFQSISEDLGISVEKILELTEQLISKGVVSGLVTLDKKEFLSEKCIKQKINSDAPLTEIMVKYSKIKIPEFQKMDCILPTIQNLKTDSKIHFPISTIRKISLQIYEEVVIKTENIDFSFNTIDIKRIVFPLEMNKRLEFFPSTIRLLLPSLGEINVYKLLNLKVWEFVFPTTKILQHFRTKKPVLVILDYNDANIAAYLINVLKENRVFKVYQADHLHLKRRQKSFVQTVLSLLFLEARNINTETLLAADVLENLKNNESVWISKQGSEYTHDRDALFVYLVFSAFLNGNEKQRAAAIDFLKCMRCHPGRVRFSRWKILTDIKEQNATISFFETLTKYLCVTTTIDQKQKVVAMIRKVAFDNLDPTKLLEEGFNELCKSIIRNSTVQEVLLCFTSRGKIAEIGSTYSCDSKDKIQNFFEIVEIPKMTSLETKNVLQYIIRDQRQESSLLNSIANQLISEEVLAIFPEIIAKKYGEKVGIIDFSHGLESLIGAAIAKFPLKFMPEDLIQLFEAEMN